MGNSTLELIEVEQKEVKEDTDIVTPLLSAVNEVQHLKRELRLTKEERIARQAAQVK